MAEQLDQLEAEQRAGGGPRDTSPPDDLTTQRPDGRPRSYTLHSTPYALLRRLLAALSVLLALTAVTFALLYVVPADPVLLIAGPNASAETRARIRRESGLDRPVLVRYGLFLSRAVRGDLGRSLRTGEPVAAALWARLPWTGLLSICGLASWLAIGIPLGVWGARRAGTPAEAGLLLVTIAGLSVPSFWLGLMLLYQLAYRWPVFPLGGAQSPVSLILPTLTLAASGGAYYTRLVQSQMQETLAQDYIRTARAKGLPERAVLLRHALRNALLPLVTLAGADFAVLLSGVVFTETVFAWPGIGRYAAEAVQYNDTPAVMGAVLLSGVLVVALNLLVDLLYPLLDPRLRR
jgi:peptide/nickel transport system permease protein